MENDFIYTVTLENILIGIEYSIRLSAQEQDYLLQTL